VAIVEALLSTVQKQPGVFVAVLRLISVPKSEVINEQVLSWSLPAFALG
jgi:hypothetical protein